MKSAIRVMEVALVVWVTAMFSLAPTPQEKAWSTLNRGLENKTWEKRAKAATVLGELKGDKKAERWQLPALKDDRGEVRSAAAQALGEMGAKSAIPNLMGMMNDKEPAVILAASRALIALGDDRGYDAFYAFLLEKPRPAPGWPSRRKAVA
jgi:HEAT repeat protein